jgi:DNA topoisomerase I
MRSKLMNVKSKPKCILCVRKALQESYCEYHYQALQSLRSHYKIWKIGYGDISWDDYVHKLQKMKYTGKWIKEVIEIELKK